MKTEAAPSNDVTLSWVSKKGAHTIEDIAHADLESRIRELFRKRLRAKAWLKADHSAILAQINPPGHPDPDRWTWWVETP